MTDQFRQILIRCIPRHHLVEAEHCQRRDHRLPRPAVFCVCPVKALDQQHVFVRGTGYRHGCRVEPAGARQPHRDKYSLYDAVGIVAR